MGVGPTLTSGMAGPAWRLDEYIKPVLEVIEVKRIPNRTGEERYKLIVSAPPLLRRGPRTDGPPFPALPRCLVLQMWDGHNEISGMLAMQLNHLVASGLGARCRVKLTEWVTADVQGKNVLIVLGVEVLGKPQWCSAICGYTIAGMRAALLATETHLEKRVGELGVANRRIADLERELGANKQWLREDSSEISTLNARILSLEKALEAKAPAVPTTGLLKKVADLITAVMQHLKLL